jgi:hypothetical protein
MLETRHQIRQWGDRALGLLSMSALLAFALFPAVSNAEDSSGIQYSDAPPTVTGKVTRESPQGSSSTDRGRDGSRQSSTRPGSNADGKSGDGSRVEGGAGPGGGDGGSGGEGKQQGDAPAGQAPGSLDVAPASTDDGGGSPLVPILIALAVLAAISIGAVAMRRKRQDSDPASPVSPEAG